MVILRAENPKYKDKHYTKKDKKEVVILGKAIKFLTEVIQLIKITQKENGMYTAQVFMGRDSHGKQIRKNLTHESKKGLQQMIRNAETERLIKKFLITAI